MHLFDDVPDAQLNAAVTSRTNFRPSAYAGGSVWRRSSNLIGICLLLALQACSTGWVRMNHSAQQAGVTRHVVSGNTLAPDLTVGFIHTVFVKAAADASMPVVFIEGDGLPWRNYGWQPNPDPRPEHALAFNLFLQTPGTVWYITRPCYDDSLSTPGCNSMVWTDARYSTANVNSMASALRRLAAEQHAQKLLLVGYSGGGTLAVLLAAQMPEVAGVVTIAANLDQAAWTQARQYSPLLGSLNAATDTSELPMPHLALHGRRDDNVPVATLSGFIATHSATRWKYIDDYNHVCCWERDWPSLWPEVLHALWMQ